MKRVVLMFALLFAVALIPPANSLANPFCGDGVLGNGWTSNCYTIDGLEYCEECDPGPPQNYGVLDPAGDCPGECLPDCTCPEPPICGDGVVNQVWEECDPPDDGACPDECVECLCPKPGTCEPRTQGGWQRICDGVFGDKREHPETPEGFSDIELCGDLMVRGNDLNDPCVRSASQIAALKLNNKYGMLDDSCKVYYDDMDMTVGEVLDIIDALNNEDCKAAADLAEAINSGDAL